MVSANSQLALIHGLLMNSVNNRPVFAQMVHNTDDDSLQLLVISDFLRFTVQQVLLDKVTHPLWLMIFKRFG